MNKKIPVTLATIALCLVLISHVGCQGNSDQNSLDNLSDQNFMVRNEAINLVMEEGITDAVPKLIEFLDPSVYQATRLLAVKALGSLGDTRAVAPLITILADPDLEVRLAVIEALGKIEDQGAVEPLITALQDTDIRYTAIWALGSIGGQEAATTLTRLLNDPDKYVRYNAGQALKTISDNNE